MVITSRNYLLGEVEGWGPNPTERVWSEVTQSVVFLPQHQQHSPFYLEKKKVSMPCELKVPLAIVRIISEIISSVCSSNQIFTV